MDNSFNHESRELDDLLAGFSDKALTGSDMMATKPLAKYDELEKLQKTVLQLQSAVQAAQPNPVTSARIRQNLMEEWQKNMPPEPSALQRFIAFWSLPRLALVGCVVAVLALFISNKLDMTGADELSGSAGVATPAAAVTGNGSSFLILIVFGIIALSLFAWFIRRR